MFATEFLRSREGAALALAAAILRAGKVKLVAQDAQQAVASVGIHGMSNSVYM